MELNNKIFIKGWNKFIKNNPNSPFFKKKKIYKIPSAWLIDQCGYKSIKYKTLSMHKEQALVMINSFNTPEFSNIDLEM